MSRKLGRNGKSRKFNKKYERKWSKSVKQGGNGRKLNFVTDTQESTV